MTTEYLTDADVLPRMPERRDLGIGVVGAGFIVRDCHLVAYRDAGFPVVGITSRTRERAEEVAELRKVGKVYDNVECLMNDADVTILDIAVPPAEQPGVIARVLAHRQAKRIRGILAQKPLAMSIVQAKEIVESCDRAGVVLQVNQNMRYDHSVRALKTLLDRKVLGEPVSATIEMRAIPHWMPWAENGRSLSTFIMSIHHLDTFRYWLGDPVRILASTRPDPRTTFAHRDGINFYILEYKNGARASAWDDVWAGPAHEGCPTDLFVRWRVEGTDGFARGEIGWPSWPERRSSTIDYATLLDGGKLHQPRWPYCWFPDAFAGPMAGLLSALENCSTPDISGRDNLRTIALCEAAFASSRDHRAATIGEFLCA